MGLTFGRAAQEYDRFRPEYPADAVTLALGGSGAVLDLGAGTGKLTRLLEAAGADPLYAVEPDEQMLDILRRRSPSVTALRGSAERIPLPDGAVDVVTAGQAMHWFDLDQALPEIHRVLRPGGRLVGLWNTSDATDSFTRSWLELLDATVRPHGGATGQTAYVTLEPRPPFTARSEFTDPHCHVVEWQQTLTPDELRAQAFTFSYVLTAEPAAQQALSDGIAKLTRGLPAVTLAERCQVWTAQRR